jgi:hypothetical protein
MLQGDDNYVGSDDMRYSAAAELAKKGGIMLPQQIDAHWGGYENPMQSVLNASQPMQPFSMAKVIDGVKRGVTEGLSKANIKLVADSNQVATMVKNAPIVKKMKTR